MMKKIFLVASILLFGLATSAWSTLTDTGNLLINGGAEDEVGDEWVVGWNSGYLKGGTHYTRSQASVGSYGPNEGSYHFYATATSSVSGSPAESSVLRQTVDVSDFDFDENSYATFGGDFAMYFSAYNGNIGTQVNIYYYDSSDSLLDSYGGWAYLGAANTNGGSIVNDKTFTTAAGAIPTETASIIYEVSRYDWTMTCNTYFSADDLFLTLNEVSEVPLPGSILAFLTGIAGFATFRKREKK